MSVVLKSDGCAVMTLGKARMIAGTLGFPSKMPGTSYGLPATACITGAKLAKIEGTTCSKCYALPSHQRGGYKWPRAVRGMQYRLNSLTHPGWVDALIKLLTHTHRKTRIRVDLGHVGIRRGQRIRYNVPGFHRWHDSGDLQSVDHLAKICAVARNTPQIRHWLPTNELAIVRAYVTAGGIIPDNLIIRVSSVFVDDRMVRNWPHTSSVYRHFIHEGSHVCPAHQQDNECKDCRACWDKSIKHVAYELH